MIYILFFYEMTSMLIEIRGYHICENVYIENSHIITSNYPSLIIICSLTTYTILYDTFMSGVSPNIMATSKPWVGCQEENNQRTLLYTYDQPRSIRTHDNHKDEWRSYH